MALYYKQLSADIIMCNYKIETSFVGPEMPKAWANKTFIDIMIIHFYIHRKLDVVR